MLAAAGLAACSKSAPAEKREPTGGAEQRYEEVVIKFADPGNAGVLAYAKREGVLERARQGQRENRMDPWSRGVQRERRGHERRGHQCLGRRRQPGIGALLTISNSRSLPSAIRAAFGKQASSRRPRAPFVR